jgi:hypothetical protein
MDGRMSVGILLVAMGIIGAIYYCAGTLILVFIGIVLIIQSISKPSGSQYDPHSHSYPSPGYSSRTPQPHQYPTNHPNYHKQVQREYVNDMRYKQATAKYKSQKKRICPHCDEYASFEGNICSNCGQDYQKIPEL